MTVHESTQPIDSRSLSRDQRIDAITRLRAGIARLVQQIEQVERTDQHYWAYCERVEHVRGARVPLDQFYRLVEELAQYRSTGRGSDPRARAIEHLLLLPSAHRTDGSPTTGPSREREPQSSAAGTGRTAPTSPATTDVSPAAGDRETANDARQTRQARPVLDRVKEELVENRLGSAIAGLAKVVGFLNIMDAPNVQIITETRNALETLGALDDRLSAEQQEMVVTTLERLDEIASRVKS